MRLAGFFPEMGANAEGGGVAEVGQGRQHGKGILPLEGGDGGTLGKVGMEPDAGPRHSIGLGKDRPVHRLAEHRFAGEQPSEKGCRGDPRRNNVNALCPQVADQVSAHLGVIVGNQADAARFGCARQGKEARGEEPRVADSQFSGKLKLSCGEPASDPREVEGFATGGAPHGPHSAAGNELAAGKGVEAVINNGADTDEIIPAALLREPRPHQRPKVAIEVVPHIGMAAFEIEELHGSVQIDVRHSASVCSCWQRVHGERDVTLLLQGQAKRG